MIHFLIAPRFPDSPALHPNIHLFNTPSRSTWSSWPPFSSSTDPLPILEEVNGTQNLWFLLTYWKQAQEEACAQKNSHGVGIIKSWEGLQEDLVPKRQWIQLWAYRGIYSQGWEPQIVNDWFNEMWAQMEAACFPREPVMGSWNTKQFWNCMQSFPGTPWNFGKWESTLSPVFFTVDTGKHFHNHIHRVHV